MIAGELIRQVYDSTVARREVEDDMLMIGHLGYFFLSTLRGRNVVEVKLIIVSKQSSYLIYHLIYAVHCLWRCSHFLSRTRGHFIKFWAYV